MEQNTLTHHGIKGQKWGVRRFQTKSGSLTAAGKKRYGKDDEAKVKSKDKSSSDAHEDYKKVRAKTVKQMSDTELKDAVNRLAMEKRYAELNPKKKSIGKKFIDEFIMPAAKEIGKDYVKRYMKDLADKADKAINEKTKTKEDDKSDNKTDTNSDNKSNNKTDDKTDNKSNDKSNNKSDGGNDKTSHFSGSSNRTVYDVEWEDVADSSTSSRGSSFMSNVSNIASTVSDTAQVFSGLASKMSSYTPQVSSGQSFVAGLLEPPKKK